MCVSVWQERTVAKLQTIGARCEARTAQLSSLQRHVAGVVENARDRHLEDWAKELAVPMALTKS